MARPVTRTWYRIALARPGPAGASGAPGTPVLVAASGEHLGAAVAAAERHVPGGWPIAAELASSDQVPLGESVGKHPVVSLEWPGAGEGAPGGAGGAGGAGGERETQAAPSADIPAFRWPSGVLPQLGRAEGVRGVRRGYAIHEGGPVLAIEAQTDGEHLVDLFLGLIERLPAADNLEVRVLDHFEDTGRADVWLTARVNAKKILRFLDDYDVDLIHNGHVELSVYVRAHKATLRLTEHKTVVWIAEERALEAEVTGWLRELGVPRISPLVTVAAVPHFHYRLAKSRDRKKLSEELYRQRLRRVDSVDRRGASIDAGAGAGADGGPGDRDGERGERGERDTAG
jgi:hypothetical protein